MPDTPDRRKLTLGLAGISLLAVGGIAGAAVDHQVRPPVAMAPVHAVPIRSLATSQGIVTVKGRVAETFGNRLVIDDGTGRTLVDGGPRGDALNAPLGSIIAVQGRFDRGAFHPAFLVDASGTVTPVGPPPGPHGPHGPHGPGPDGPDGPRPDRAPPPPASASVAPPPAG